MSQEEGPSVEELTTASQAGSQETTMVGAIGSYFDFGSVSEGTPEFRDAGEEIRLVGVRSVREGEFFDIQVDTGVRTSKLTRIHCTKRCSARGGHHFAAGGGKLHELGARMLGLEAGDVRGSVVNFLVRFRVLDDGKALLSTQRP